MKRNQATLDSFVRLSSSPKRVSRSSETETDGEQCLSASSSFESKFDEDLDKWVCWLEDLKTLKLNWIHNFFRKDVDVDLYDTRNTRLTSSCPCSVSWQIASPLSNCTYNICYSWAYFLCSSKAEYLLPTCNHVSTASEQSYDITCT